MTDIFQQLIKHEGVRLKPYRDKVGKLTIGVGRNLEDKGISKKEAEMMLVNDVQDIIKQLNQYDWFNKLDHIRRKVIIDMAFNLGVNGLLQFKNMIQAIKDDDYQLAGEEMIDSKWYRQHQRWGSLRAKRLVKMMKTGEDYEGVN